MATQREGQASQETTATPPASLAELVQERYRKIKEHAETYPYVWGSYTLVYGGLALWTIYRWRKLRKTEDRVRALQERLRKLVENEEAANSGTSVKKAPTSDDKVPKQLYVKSSVSIFMQEKESSHSVWECIIKVFDELASIDEDSV